MGQDVFKVDKSREVKNNSVTVGLPAGQSQHWEPDLNPFDKDVVPSGTYDKMANWYDYEDQAYDTGSP